MTDAEKVRLYKACCQKAVEAIPYLNVCIEHDNFMVYKPIGSLVGKFETIDSLYYFLCGYEWGTKDG